MDFTVKQPTLLRELEILQGVVEKKNTVPILANVVMAAGPEGVEIMATDLEVSVRGRMEAAVGEPGGVSVSAKKLHEIVRLLPDADVTIRREGEGWVTIVCGRSRFRVMGLNPEDFPSLPAPPAGPRVRIPAAQLRSMVERVIFAVTSDDTRFALNGALLLLKEGSITLVSSDGHRLALVRESLDGRGAELEERVLIPRKALGRILEIAGAEGDEVFYCRKENHLFFDVGVRRLSSRVLEGTFPNFEKVVPVGNDKQIQFDREELSTALTRVSVLANERSRAVRIAFRDGKAEVSSRNPELGEASESLDVEYGGGDMEVGFNGKYLLDFLAVAGTEKVLFEVKDEVTQGVMRPVGGPSAEYTYVIMPMRL
jgi:DNA polymerase-3 subunit beta